MPCAGQTQISDLTALRLRYDGDSHTLFVDFDPNAHDADDSWVNLATTSEFLPGSVSVFGQSSGRSFTAGDHVYGDDIVTTAVIVPEPSTYAALVLGLGMLGWLTRASRARWRPDRPS